MNRKIYYLLVVGIILGVFSCTEEPEPVEKVPNYYFKFEAEGKDYFFGFDEIGDQFNPFEIYQGALTQNKILYNNGVLFTWVRDECGKENQRDCIMAAMNIKGYSEGKFLVTEINEIGGNGISYSPMRRTDLPFGSLDFTITKLDKLNRIMEAEFSGRLYNGTINAEVLVPVKGNVRAYYNPN